MVDFLRNKALAKYKEQGLRKKNISEKSFTFFYFIQNASWLLTFLLVILYFVYLGSYLDKYRILADNSILLKTILSIPFISVILAGLKSGIMTDGGILHSYSIKKERPIFYWVDIAIYILIIIIIFKYPL